MCLHEALGQQRVHRREPAGTSKMLDSLEEGQQAQRRICGIPADHRVPVDRPNRELKQPGQSGFDYARVDIVGQPRQVCIYSTESDLIGLRLEGIGRRKRSGRVAVPEKPVGPIDRAIIVAQIGQRAQLDRDWRRTRRPIALGSTCSRQSCNCDSVA